MNADSAAASGVSFSGQELRPTLVQSALLAWQIAPDTCLPTTDAFRGCADYHGLYPLLHAVGLAATPDRHAAFYAQELGALAGTGKYPAVLVSGSADQGMLEHVADAYAGTELVLEMLDLCPTPGVICSAWADSLKLELRTHAANILEWQPEHQFDVVTTHSFIAKFGPEVRARLFAAWQRILRPGGKLVTTARIDPSEAEPDAGFDEAAASGFAHELAAAVEPWRESLGIDSDRLNAVAWRHCDGIKSYAIPSVKDLRALLESNGFEIDSLDLVTHAGRLKKGESGAGTHRTARYADFVATRA